MAGDTGETSGEIGYSRETGLFEVFLVSVIRWVKFSLHTTVSSSVMISTVGEEFTPDSVIQPVLPKKKKLLIVLTGATWGVRASSRKA
jgi:hypothetical protein